METVPAATSRPTHPSTNGVGPTASEMTSGLPVGVGQVGWGLG